MTEHILEVFGKEECEIKTYKEESKGMNEKKSVFSTLNEVDVSKFTEKKSNLTYLSWTYAWANVVERYPDANYEIIKFENGKPYYMDETGAMVYTTVTIEGVTREMWLPVMDGANKSMKLEAYTYKVKDWNETKKQKKDIFKDKTVDAISMFDVNKTIMRCLVKNLAMFGIGINVYAGEDLPLDVKDEPKVTQDQVTLIKKLFADKRMSVSDQNKGLKGYGVSKVEDLTLTDATAIIKKLQG